MERKRTGPEAGQYCQSLVRAPYTSAPLRRPSFGTLSGTPIGPQPNQTSTRNAIIFLHIERCELPAAHMYSFINRSLDASFQILRRQSKTTPFHIAFLGMADNIATLLACRVEHSLGRYQQDDHIADTARSPGMWDHQHRFSCWAKRASIHSRVEFCCSMKVSPCPVTAVLSR